jgi:hypothetical protein
LRGVEDIDPVIAQVIAGEYRRQQDVIDVITSETSNWHLACRLRGHVLLHRSVRVALAALGSGHASPLRQRRSRTVQVRMTGP